MKKMTKGIIFTIISAIIFGFTPILARITYDGGSNPVMTTLLRSILVLPVFVLILRRRGVPILARGRSLADLLLLGGFFSAVTTILLYMSYAYIPVGMSTTLHFVYPVCVSLGCVIFFKDRLSLPTLTALVACTVGVFLFIGRLSDGSLTGILLALASGVTIAVYMVCSEKTTLKENDYLKIAFYICLVTTLLAAAYGAATGALTFKLTPKAWLYAFLVSMFASLGGLTTLQLGIRYCGATTAAILSTFEPITSVICGALILGEALTLPKLAGCACIVFSVILISVSSRRADELEKAPKVV